MDNRPTLLFKYTSRSRPEQFKRGLLSILDNSSEQNYIILCSFDEDDPTLPDYQAAIADLTEKEALDSSKIIVKLGTSKNKIDAINRDVNEFSEHWDILINMSDDMIFIEKGFDSIIRDDMLKNFPACDGVLHYPDGTAGSKLMTMSIIGKAYYDRFLYIYHPAYVSLWCDNEATDVAKILMKYAYVPTRLFDHIHPAYGLCERDEQYEKTESFYYTDNKTYLARKNSGFKLDLAILIPTVKGRESEFKKLYDFLKGQIVSNSLVGRCEILSMYDDKEISIGLKRQRLLIAANSNYVVFVDDDDWVSDDYCASIVNEIIAKTPDSIGFLIHCTFNGANQCVAIASNRYPAWGENVDGFRYVRTPYHKTPIKKSIALEIGFKDMRFSEDHDYSKRLKASNLIQFEGFINKILYYYRFSYMDPKQKYNLQ